MKNNYTRTVGGFAVAELQNGESVKGWAGLGGSIFLFDDKNKISFSYVPGVKGGTFVRIDPRARLLMDTFYSLSK
ncbi:hypothetical protein AKO1_015080 [Acrasis kona]|uniref:Uncharacterized protein n=1 Tax=Acrasis kona TaxID=1008807 RepID=A0AAW2ZLN1_9EUKA